MVSGDWGEGYFTDTAYTYGYYREINPVFQRFCLLARGVAVRDTGEEAVHCELGFGQGVSLNVHAAANAGAFVGTDFNPSHAAHALALAGASGDRLRIYDDSFQQLLDREDLPQFDSISLHGIWTWVSRENQDVIVEFARRRLKPGGVFYVSYNCFPGWTTAYPLRQLFSLYDRYGAAPDAAPQRVEAALQFTERLLAADPLYLNAAPLARDRFDRIKSQNRTYLAHEYFNREWNCMYFTDVVERVRGAKLEFGATAAPLDLIDAVNLRPEGQQFLASIGSPILREQARDYFVNQQFRRDLFVRGAQMLSGPERQLRLAEQQLVLLTTPEEISLTINTTMGEATLQEPVYRPVIAALAADDFKPKPLQQVLSACPDLTYAQVEQAVMVLVGANHVAPCQPQPAADAAQARCAALNRRIMDRAIGEGQIEVLASPVIGGGVSVGRFPQLFLRALLEGKRAPEQWAQRTWELLEAQGQRLVKDGAVLEGAAANLEELNIRASAFARRLPIFKALMII